MSRVDFVLNGEPISLELEEGVTALHALRDRLGVVSAKDGCSGHGECGACTVLWDDKPVMACTRDAHRLQGAQITTLEGLATRKREVLSRAFVQTAAPQCGYCIPGIAVRAADLLDHKEDVSREDILKALRPHLCRCTGYHKIVGAIELAAEHWRGDTLPAVDNPTGVGDRAPRYRGAAIVMGEKPYVDDLRREGMLYGALHLSKIPRGRILTVDTSAALAMPGVHAVLTADDLSGAKLTGPIRKDTPVYAAEGDLVHCIGTVIASVAAETRELAQRAAAAIRVEYEELPVIDTPAAALAKNGPKVHDTRDNLAETCVIRRGDVDALLAGSAHVLSETFHSQRVEHAFIEAETSLAELEGDVVHVYSQGQGVHEDRHEIAAVLGWPVERVLVELVSNGGGFGGKEDVTVQHHAALLAVATGRPVKVGLTREQSMRVHPKRHPLDMEYTVGCDAEGRLTAARIRIVGDTGAYLSVGDKILERAAGHSCGPYFFQAVDIEALTVYTNNVPSGAFRGFGVNQTAFAIEGMLDRLAERVGLDPYQIRERNILSEGQPFSTGQLMDSGVGIRQTLEAVREDYYAHPRAGIACGIKNTGIGNGMVDVGRAMVRIEGAGQVGLYVGFTEMGQGLHTICRQILCAETGIDPDMVHVETSTRFPVESGMTTASRATLLAGEATRRAAVALSEKLAGTTLDALVGEEVLGEFLCDFTVSPQTGGPNPVTHVTFGYATQVVMLDEEGRLEKVIAAHDAGRVINQALAEGQIEGAVHMGLGFALTEDMPAEGGYLKSTRLKDLNILRAHHTPPVEVRLIEVPDPHSAYGIKGIGEIGLVPTAAAVAGALRRFDGIWRTHLPMKGSAAARAVLPKRLHEDDHA
ncbi:MAG: selenium-dependent xanthine dehydrogenase [Deltaproteobacteria bacterium]|nr:selenium-dependent xanthine dehydrogenase [Deltaproteobacteria bacterium]